MGSSPSAATPYIRSGRCWCRALTAIPAPRSRPCPMSATVAVGETDVADKVDAVDFLAGLEAGEAEPTRKAGSKPTAATTPGAGSRTERPIPHRILRPIKLR